MSVLVFIGIVLLILSVPFLFVARANAKLLHRLNTVETYDAATLDEIHRRITTSLGASYFIRPCEVTGIIECDTPLIGPVSGRAFVAYKYDVYEEYEEEVTTRDDEGRESTTTERRSTSIESEERRIPFFVRDDTGRVLVLPDGATIDLIETVNRFVTTPQSPSWTSSINTLGWRQIERGLDVGTRVFVSGIAIDHDGKPAVASYTPYGKQPLLISRKSEQELAASAAFWARSMSYAAIASAVIGLALIVGSFLIGR
jgi:hypothetical protein